MLLKFSIFDLFFLSFVQLVLSTVLVLSPARGVGTRFRWTGSRITEVLVGGVGAAAIAALACVLTHALWGLPIGGLETAAYLLVIVSVIVMALQPNTNFVGQVFYASYLSASLTFIVYAAFIAVVATHSILETLTASLVILLDLGAFVVWISNINYVSDVLCRARRSRPLPKADPGYQPLVSLHIPAYNEPPELLIETIKAVERIDYPNFEVVVIDNNTADPAVWGPVEEYCRDRPRVKFVHVAPWPGYKAGACNLALRRYTDPRAEIIGLVDADDIVQPYYLRETAGYFSDPGLGFLQTFEGNREFHGSNYYTACVDSFQAFYLSVMSSRNERDTVPFVGTMGLFRRSALTAVGRLERVVHLRRHRGIAAGAAQRLVGAVHSALLRAGRRAAQLQGDAHPAASLVLRRHADHAAALAEPVAVGPLAGQPSHRRAAPRLPDGLGRVVPGCADAGLQLAAAGDQRAAGHRVRVRHLPDGRRPVAAAALAHYHRHHLDAVDVAHLDDHVVSPGAAVAGHQLVGDLGGRPRLS